jgi:hypothetical protein
LFGLGLHPVPNQRPSGANGQFSNINLDGGDVGLDIYATQDYGIHFSNLNIACASNYGQFTRRAIWAHNTSDPNLQIGPLNIHNGSFWGTFKDHVILWETGGPLQLSSSIIREWPDGTSAIKILGGRATIQGNFFQDSPPITNRSSVYIDANAERVIVTGNNLTGNPIVSSGPANLRLIASNLD